MLAADQRAQRALPPFGATTRSVLPVHNCGLTREKRVAAYFRCRKSTGWQAIT